MIQSSGEVEMTGTNQPVVFLKLGGSLITDKNRPHTPRMELIRRLAAEILAAREKDASLRLLLGHGSGSFGHIPARRYGTRQGVQTEYEWHGFVEVWRAAVQLNRIVVDALGEAGLPAISLPPSSSTLARDGQVETWNLAPVRRALEANLLPVIFGDVVFDSLRGGTILSTEDLFSHLAGQLQPGRILLAGTETGVWADFPICTRLVEKITPANWKDLSATVGGSTSTDVTGGMASKVRQSLELVGRIPHLEVLIFSGETPGAIEQALTGKHLGTRIQAG
jgi:isopentenyl phosphate kinase